MAEIIREPQQKRSIDTKNKIIAAGYELFAEKGYFNTNTAEIAKRAQVSTGIVYGYFHDKRDIMVEVLDIYINKAFNPIKEMIENLKAPFDFDFLISEIIEKTLSIHKNNAAIHEAMHSLSATDNLVNKRFLELEDEISLKVAESLKKVGYNKENLEERIHVALTLVQSFSHESVYDKHKYLDYEKMKKIVIENIKNLF